MGLAAAAFLLGWLLGRGNDPPAPETPRARDVELRLDAGGVSLMPDGGLELKPIRPLDAGAGGESQ